MEFYSDSKHFKKIKDYLRNLGPLKICDSIDNTEDLLLQKASVLNEEKDPVVKVEKTLLEIFDLIHKSYVTTDLQNNLITKNALNRTLGELYRITINIHPKITLKTFTKALSSLMQKELVATIICVTIKKRVYFLNNNRGLRTRPSLNKIFSGEPVDEFYLDWEKIMPENFPFNATNYEHVNEDIGGFYHHCGRDRLYFYDYGEEGDNDDDFDDI